MSQIDIDRLWCERAAFVLRGTYTPISYRDFRAFFGISPQTAHDISEKYLKDTPWADPKYLFYFLGFVKAYPKDRVAHYMFHGTNERYFRDNLWAFVDFLFETLHEV